MSEHVTFSFLTRYHSTSLQKRPRVTLLQVTKSLLTTWTWHLLLLGALLFCEIKLQLQLQASPSAIFMTRNSICKVLSFCQCPKYVRLSFGALVDVRMFSSYGYLWCLVARSIHLTRRYYCYTADTERKSCDNVHVNVPTMNYFFILILDSLHRCCPLRSGYKMVDWQGNSSFHLHSWSSKMDGHHWGSNCNLADTYNSSIPCTLQDSCCTWYYSLGSCGRHYSCSTQGVRSCSTSS